MRDRSIRIYKVQRIDRSRSLCRTKKCGVYTDRPSPFHSIGEGRFIQIGRSVNMDRSIPCPGKYPKSIFLVFFDYIRIDSHLI